jgi:citrate synthase
MYDVFWRPGPLKPEEKQLLDALYRAHQRSVFRDNPSSVTIANAAFGSGDLAKALAAGLLTIGGAHAPISETIEFLNQPMPQITIPFLIETNKKVPGWGGTFQKDGPDSVWDEVNSLIPQSVGSKIDAVTKTLHEHAKFIFPNPSAYTAATAIALSMPVQLAPYLFIAARLAPWTMIAAGYLLPPEGKNDGLGNGGGGSGVME